MLCKRWTSMISANFSRNAYGKNWKLNFFFFLKLINTNVWIPQNFNYNENETILKFLWFSLFLEGGGFVVKLVAAKVTRQHMIFFTASYFLFDNLWKKEDMIALVHENHDKWPNITPVQHFCSGFDHANLVSSFRGSKYIPKI